MASRQFITLTPAASQAAPGPRGPARDRQDRSSRRRSRAARSEEHTSELQSLRHLVCRLLLEKKTNIYAAAPEAPHGRAAMVCARYAAPRGDESGRREEVRVVHCSWTVRRRAAVRSAKP